MPQMAPMMWLILFIMFLLSLMCFSAMNYFLLHSQKKSKVFSPILTTVKHWKW